MDKERELTELLKLLIDGNRKLINQFKIKHNLIWDEFHNEDDNNPREKLCSDSDSVECFDEDKKYYDIIYKYIDEEDPFKKDTKFFLKKKKKKIEKNIV